MVSELRRARPAPPVLRWLGDTPPADLRLSVVTLGEIERGVWLLEPGPGRTLVESFLREVARDFSDRLLDVGVREAAEWGRLSAHYRRSKVQVSVADELIAATARVHDLTLVTRNTRDFEHAGVRLLDPWRAA